MQVVKDKIPKKAKLVMPNNPPDEHWAQNSMHIIMCLAQRPFKIYAVSTTAD